MNNTIIYFYHFCLFCLWNMIFKLNIPLKHKLCLNGQLCFAVLFLGLLLLLFDSCSDFLSMSFLLPVPLCEVCSSFRSLISPEKICDIYVFPNV